MENGEDGGERKKGLAKRSIDPAVERPGDLGLLGGLLSSRGFPSLWEGSDCPWHSPLWPQGKWPRGTRRAALRALERGPGPFGLFVLGLFLGGLGILVQGISGRAARGLVGDDRRTKGCRLGFPFPGLWVLVRGVCTSFFDL